MVVERFFAGYGLYFDRLLGAARGWVGDSQEILLAVYEASIYWGKIGLLIAFVLCMIAFAIYLIVG